MSNEIKTIEQLADFCYDQGELCQDPNVSMLVYLNTSRDVNGADGPSYILADQLAQLRANLKWSDLEFVTMVMSALKSAVKEEEHTGYNFSDDDFASVGYTQEVHLQQLIQPFIDAE